MTEMTPERLAEIRERAEVLTRAIDAEFTKEHDAPYEHGIEYYLGAAVQVTRAVPALLAEVERLRAELADANRFLDQRRNDVAAWRDSYERLSRQVLRRHHAWQSARRGRKHARAELATVRREAHRDRLAVDGALDRIAQLIGERNQAEADVDRAETERDRLAEQVKRVRELHPKRDNPRYGCCGGYKICTEPHPPVCWGNSHGLNKPEWPCPEIRALDETEAGT